LGKELSSHPPALGGRAAVDQVLSRLVKRGALLRAGRGIYVLPVESRFGAHAPSISKMVEGLASQRGETIVLHGAAAANALGLTTQVPMKAIYLTSGRNRRLKVGAQTVEFRHAPIWQLIFPGRLAGEVVRALAWLGPEKAGGALRKLRSKLQPSELEEVASAPRVRPGHGVDLRSINTNKKGHPEGWPLLLVVEAAGIEPASASTLQTVLHT
jgi:hypothetical protein